MVLRYREILREVEQAGGNPVVPLLGDRAAAPAADSADDGLGADEVEGDPCDDLEQRVQPFQSNAKDEDLMDALFLHGAAHNEEALEK